MEHELECYRPKTFGCLHNCHPARKLRDTNLFLACVGIIYEGADILRNEFVGITTEINTVDDMPTRMRHIWTRFLRPILRLAACNRICLRIPLALA